MEDARPSSPGERPRDDEDYFASTVYGAGHGASPKQSAFDRARDGLILKLVRRYSDPRAGDSAILDVGCGYGYLLERFRGRLHLYGTDVSAHAVERARERLPDATVAEGDVQLGLPFDLPFRVIVAVNVLEHLTRPEAALRNLHDALAPGGLLVLHLPTITNRVSRRLYRLWYQKDPTHIYRPSGEGVRALAESAGLRPIMETHAPFVPAGLWRALPWHPAYLGVFRRPAD